MPNDHAKERNWIGLNSVRFVSCKGSKERIGESSVPKRKSSSLSEYLDAKRLPTVEINGPIIAPSGNVMAEVSDTQSTSAIQRARAMDL